MQKCLSHCQQNLASYYFFNENLNNKLVNKPTYRTSSANPGLCACQKCFYPRPWSSQEAEYTLYNYII